MTTRERENPVDWLVVDRKTTATVIVSRQTWHEAIREGAVELGTAPEHCTCVRVGVDMALSSGDRTVTLEVGVGPGLGTAGLTRPRVRVKGSARA